MGLVRMKTLTEDAVHALLPLAEQNQVTVQWESEDISYQGNLQQLQQLLTNLMSNAIKYNKPGGTVKILVRMIEQGMQITVSDTGIGIPEEYRQRIFERFFRVDKGRSRKMGGTGLGLSIVKHIVNCYHGFVSVKS